MSLEAVSTKRNRNLPQQLTLDHVSPATRLLEKRRQMFEVQEALNSQKDEFNRREDAYCLLYTSPSPRDYAASRMPSSA